MKKRLIALLMALVSTLTFVGCNDSTDSSSGGGEQPTDRRVSERTLTNGVHDYTAPERENEYFVKDGVCEYRIIAPNSAQMGVKAKAAVTEFNFFLKEATGITIPFTHESEVNVFTHNDTNKYISIGNTKLLESAGLSGDFNELGVSGLRIKTLGNTIYLYGAYDDGHLYAVYDFMQIMFNYEIYATDLWEIDKVDTVKMRDFNVVDIPDTAARETGWVELQDQSHNGYLRFRTGGTETILVGDKVYNEGAYGTYNGTARIHNVLDVVAVGNPAVEKDKWYSDVGTQLCYTAHGDDASRERMIKHVASIIESNLIDNKNKPDEEAWCFTFTCEDGGGGVCLCDGCRADIDKYGASAASVILFCNDLMTEIESWWELPENAEYKRENLYCLFFAYSDLNECPATYNATTGKYELNNGLTIHPKVGTYLCNDKINHNYSIYHEINDQAREDFVAWMDVSNELYIWLYDNNFHFDLSFWDAYGHYDNEGYSFYLSYKPRAVFMEVGTGYVRTSFSQLKMYLQSKLLWDCSLDHNELIDKWFKASFGVSAGVMKQLFDSEATYEKAMYAQKGSLNTPSFLVDVNAKQYWSLSAVKEWLDILDNAYQANERYNKEYFPEKYEMIKKNIDREYIYPAYVIIQIFSEEECGETYTKVMKYLKENDQYFSNVGNELSALSSKWRSFSIDE